MFFKDKQVLYDPLHPIMYFVINGKPHMHQETSTYQKKIERKKIFMSSEKKNKGSERCARGKIFLFVWRILVGLLENVSVSGSGEGQRS